MCHDAAGTGWKAGGHAWGPWPEPGGRWVVLHSVSHSGLSQAASLTLTLYFQTDLSLSGNIENVLLIYDSFFVFSSIIEFKKNLGRAKVFLDKGLNIGMAAILLGRMTHHLARPKWNSQIRTDRTERLDSPLQWGPLAEFSEHKKISLPFHPREEDTLLKRLETLK